MAELDHPYTAAKPHTPSRQISVLVSNVDGTLVNASGDLTEENRRALRRLGEEGLSFTLASSRAPGALRQLVDILKLQLPFAACSGALVLEPDFRVSEQRILSFDTAQWVMEIMADCGLEIWLYADEGWYVHDDSTIFVRYEADLQHYAPKQQTYYGDLGREALKVTGVSQQHHALARCADMLGLKFGSELTISRSRPYRLDVTRGDANKGAFVRYLAGRLKTTPDRIATLGAWPDDIPMFQQSGLSITMDNAVPEALAAADFKTTSDEQQGFLNGVHDLLLTLSTASGA